MRQGGRSLLRASQTDAEVGGRAKCRVAPFVKAGGDGTVLFGINAFHALELTLTWKSVCPRRSDNQKGGECI